MANAQTAFEKFDETLAMGERVYSVIKRDIKNIFGENDNLSLKIVSVAYMAHVSKCNYIENTKELIEYTETGLDEVTYRFVSSNIDDLWFLSVRNKDKYSKDELASCVLFALSLIADNVSETVLKTVALILNKENAYAADFCRSARMFSFVMNMMGSGVSCSMESVNDIVVSLYLKMIGNTGVYTSKHNPDVKYDRIFCDLSSRNETTKQQRKASQIQINDILDENSNVVTDIVNHLNEDGKAVVLIDGKMSASSGTKALRQYVAENGYLESVIILPRGINMKNIQSYLLIISFGNTSVDLVDCSSCKFNKANINDVAYDIFDSYINKEVVKTVSLAEMKSNEYSFHTFQYEDKDYCGSEMTINYVPFGNVIKSMRRGFQCPVDKLNEITCETSTGICYIMLKNICDGKIVKPDLFIKTGSIHKRNIIKNKCLLLSKNLPMKTAVAECDGYDIVLNGNLYSIEIDETQADPYFVQAYLDSLDGCARFEKLYYGDRCQALTVSSIETFQIPLPSLEKQHMIGNEYRKCIQKIASQRECLEKSIEKAGSLYSSLIHESGK